MSKHNIILAPVFYCLLMLSSVTPVYTQDMNGWEGIINTQFFEAGQFLSEQKIIVVGDEGQIRLSSDGGNTWTSNNQSKDLNFHTVSFIDSLNGMIASYVGHIFRTSDGGRTWLQLRGRSANTINKLVMITPDTIFACGNRGSIIRSTNGGTSWDSLISGTPFHLNNVYFSTSQFGFAVGDSGTIIRTIDAGKTWATVPIDSNIQLRGIDFCDSLHGAICGQGIYIYLTSDGGITWVKKVVADNVDLTLPLITYHSRSRITTMTNGGGSYESTNNGKTWRQIHLPNEMQETSIMISGSFSKDKRKGVVGGYPNVIITSTDSGSSWQQGASCPIINTFIYDFKFFDTLNGYAVGDHSLIMKTSNGGQTWKSLIPNLDNIQFFRIYSPDPDTMLLIGWYKWLINSANGGKTFTEEKYPSIPEFNIVSYRHPSDMYMVNSEIGYIVGDTIVWKTTDGTKTWIPIMIWSYRGALMHNVFFPSEKVGFILGIYDIAGDSTRPYFAADLLFRTQDGGKTWDTLHYGNPRICLQLYFWNTLKGMMLCNGGVILKTIDGGNSWYEVPNPPKINNKLVDLGCVNFFNDQIGFISAQGGRIFISTDAGESWKMDLDLGITQFKKYAYLWRFIFPDSNTVMVAGVEGILKKKIDFKKLSVPVVEESPISNYLWISLVQNPVSSVLKGKYYWHFSESKSVFLKIYDIMGREVRDVTRDLLPNTKDSVVELTTDISSLPNGVYLLVLSAGGNARSERFVVSK